MTRRDYAPGVQQTVQTIGLDIGGATLKAATPAGMACARRFALWRQPERLAEELRSLIVVRPSARLAVTMTAELCDCFETKAHGVRHVLDAVAAAFPSVETWVWQTTGRFASPADALVDAWLTAAANWLALATFAVRHSAGQNSILIDIGSTTTDIVPLSDGRPCPKGRTDPERLASGELVYTGVVRTPIFSVLDTIRVSDREYATMAEFFATAADAYLILGKLSEDARNYETADGRPMTRSAARDRLARVIGADRTRFSIDDAAIMAHTVERCQAARIADATTRVVEESLGGKLNRVIISGQGEFLANISLDACAAAKRAERIVLSRQLDPSVSRAACAFAVAVLLDELA